jgi:hypothetical protein
MVTLGWHNCGLGHGGGPGSWWLSFSGKFGKSAVDHVILFYEPKLITSFRAIAVLCGTDIILWNIPHIQFECEEYFTVYYQFDRIFFTFKLNVRNILQNTISPAEQCNGSE